FFSLLENGWHLLLIAPRNYYYSQAFRLMPVIFILALSLASLLGYLLVRLSAAKRRSEEESRSKSYFLARMSHEIRTPLNVIIGLGELALRNYGQPQGRSDLEEIRRAGYNLLAIANDILDLSKVESGRLELNPGPYKTATLLSDIMVLAESALGGRDLELSVSADPNLPAELVGDELRVRQIIMNLMTNAIKYTPEGFVRLALKGEPADGNQFRLLFTVEDSGPGLKPEQTAVIFDDFVRLEAPSRERIEGTGLGLPIARRFCQAMGGDISVTSEYGRGTTFLAEIRQDVASPGILLGEFKPGRPSPDQSPCRPAPFLAPDFRVLVVDDIATNLGVADGLLSLYQMRTTLCLSGREAIEAAKKDDYDLFFIDHMMPDMDGLATLKALRQINGAPGKAPMIALTANALAGMKEMFLNNGFDDYLSKPIELESLNGLLERLVPPGRRLKAPDQPARPFPNEPLAAVGALEGFDPAAGQNRLGGSAEKYRAVLATFLRDLESRRPLLAPEADRDSLIINLHALKAALGNIGASKLAAEAVVLEAAAKGNDQPALAAGLRPFNAGLDQLESVIRAGLETEASGNPSALKTLPAETLRELKAALKIQDMGRIDEACERLSRAAPGGNPARAILAAISDHILLSDYQEAEALVDQLLREAVND
ncbi:MAG: response regulator, partial [Candidatus Adiutrix sp.]|nr:response regulator [Candidatus Adiutrix sp.]